MHFQFEIHLRCVWVDVCLLPILCFCNYGVVIQIWCVTTRRDVCKMLVPLGHFQKAMDNLVLFYKLGVGELKCQMLQFEYVQGDAIFIL